MRVGIPCMKCSLSPSTQINKKTGKAAKTCGVGSAWKEMNDERLGRDPTIDKTMTHLNVWMVGDSKDDVEKMVQEEIASINKKRKASGKRSLRKDCVSVVEIVEKPNMEFMQNLNYEEKKSFLNTSHEVMKSLIHEWNPNWKIIEAVQHHDEFGGFSAHNHTLVLLSTIDKNGLPNMQAKSEMNLKFFNFINSNYSKKMQKAGYDVEDVKTYDRLSEEEKLERKLNPKEHGVDAYIFKKKKEEELLNSIKEKQITETNLSKDIEEQVKIKAETDDLKSYKEILIENKDLKIELREKNHLIQNLQDEILSLKSKLSKIQEKFQILSEKIGTKILNVFHLKDDNVKNEYPDKILINEVNKMQNDLNSIDIKHCRIVPDDKNEGCFKIIDRENNKVIKNNIVSRKNAEKLMNEIKKIANKEEIKLKRS